MAKKKTPPAGVKADDKPGTDALQRLLDYFSHDNTKIFGQNAMLSQYVAEAAHAALASLEAGNAEEAVWHAMRAMDVYGDIRHLADGREYQDDMKHVAEWWKTKTEWALDQWKKPRVKAKESRGREFAPKLETAIETYMKLRNQRGDATKPSDFALRKKAARLAGISEKSLRKHLPAYLR